MTSRSLSCTSVVCKGEMPNVNASGRSENAFKKPIFMVRRYSISADALRRLKVPEGTHLVVTAVEVDDERLGRGGTDSADTLCGSVSRAEVLFRGCR